MNSKQNKRNATIAAVLIAVALIGLVMINGSTSAERGVDLANFNAAQSQEVTPAEFSGSALPSLLRILSALALTIACIYAGIYALKRMSGKRGGFGGSRNLEIIETTAVAPKKMISLVRVADKAILLGVTETGISMLTELTPEKTAEILAASQAAEETDGFQKALQAAGGTLRAFGLKKKQAALEA